MTMGFTGKIEFPESIYPAMKSSENEVKSFMETSVYHDFIDEVNYRKQEIQALLVDADMDYSGRHYDVFRGGIKFAEQMLTIFEDLMHEASDKEIEEQE